MITNAATQYMNSENSSLNITGLQRTLGLRGTNQKSNVKTQKGQRCDRSNVLLDVSDEHY